MWQKATVTTASNILDLGFVGRGAIFAEGTFGGGTVQVKMKTDDGQITSGFGYELDGTTTKSVDVPAGLYRLELAGSAGASVDIWYNTQVDLTRDS